MKKFVIGAGVALAALGIAYAIIGKKADELDRNLASDEDDFDDDDDIYGDDPLL